MQRSGRRSNRLIGVRTLALRQVCALALLAIITACGGGWSLPLPHHYELVYANAYEIAIAGPEGAIVIPPHIVEYTTLGDIVTGRAEAPLALEGQLRPPERSAPGYFVLDTASGASMDGLSKGAWLVRLRKLGVGEEPELARPTRFD